ncbi:uncharacterized protein [Anabrus simplex]|uniref:uncharacterized protein isoform X2 n=1 Tax=Anabrus simplex TaxID=316456 RepID=UPI0035A29033
MVCVCLKMKGRKGSMIHVTAFVFAAVAMANTGVDGAPFPRECEADHQCVNGFCYTAVGKCTPCIDCSVYLRNAPAWNSCAKSAQECGSCMSGYEEEVFQKGAKRDFCVSIKDSQKRHDEDDKVALATAGYAALGLLIVLILAVIVIVYIRKKIPRIKPSCLGRPQGDDTPPPPYSSSPLLASAPVMSEEATNQLEVVGMKENLALQHAVPFRDPCFPYNGYDEDEEHEEEENEDDYNFGNSVLDIHDAVHDAIHDEDTVPSAWTPGEAYGHNVVGEEANTPGPSAEREEPSHDSRPESSLSTLSEAAASPDSTNMSAANRTNVGDSGVSASSSVQSSNTSLAVRHFSQFGSGNRAADSGDAVDQSLSGSRSEEDLNQSAQPCKRLRRDSGSVSMQSGPLFESGNSSSEDEMDQNSERRGATINTGTQANQFNFFVKVYKNSGHVQY